MKIKYDDNGDARMDTALTVIAIFIGAIVVISLTTSPIITKPNYNWHQSGRQGT